MKETFSERTVIFPLRRFERGVMGLTLTLFVFWD